MAELATIARPYAEALFKASQTDLQGTAAWLEPLAAVAAHPSLLAVAGHPKLGASALLDLVSGLMPQPLPAAGVNFLRTVIDNGRLQALPQVASQFRALMNAQAGSSDAQVYSAFPIDSTQLAELAGVLERRFGRRLNLSVTTDPSLIGGVRVVVGDEVLDTSVKARLEQMKVALTA